MKNYVLGFVFAQNPRTCKWWVLLIRKNRPDWMAGQWNGLGGSKEDNESHMFAMVREFSEESGLTVYLENWKLAGLMEFKKTDVAVAVYGAVIGWDELCAARTTTDEEVKSFPVDALPIDCLPNVLWLVPMALNKTRENRYFNIPTISYE